LFSGKLEKGTFFMGELAEKAIMLMRLGDQRSTSGDGEGVTTTGTPPPPQVEIISAPSQPSLGEPPCRAGTDCAYFKVRRDWVGCTLVDIPLRNLDHCPNPPQCGPQGQVSGSNKLEAPRRPQPGDCDACPAYGHREEKGPEPFCFYEAYFLGKSVLAQLAEERRENCPLEEDKPQPREPKA